MVLLLRLSRSPRAGLGQIERDCPTLVHFILVIALLGAFSSPLVLPFPPFLSLPHDAVQRSLLEISAGVLVEDLEKWLDEVVGHDDAEGDDTD